MECDVSECRISIKKIFVGRGYTPTPPPPQEKTQAYLAITIFSGPAKHFESSQMFFLNWTTCPVANPN
jgi:hypothetical protein